MPNLEEKRNEWLSLAKEIMLKAVERDSVFSHEFCPTTYNQDEKELKEALKRVANLTREIHTLAGRLAILERDGSFGAKVLGINDEITRTALAILVTARMGGSASREVKRVNEVIDLVGGRDPERCLAVRNLFREDGILFKHTNICPSVSLDESRCYIRESAFNKVVGQAVDGSEGMCDAIALAGRWER